MSIPLKDTATISGADYACYVEPRVEKITDPVGNDVVSSIFAIFDPDTPLAPKTRVIWEGATYQVIKAVPLKVRGTAHHLEVYLREVGPRATAGGV